MTEHATAKPEPDPSPSRRRRFRFGLSLRALMVVVLVSAGGLGWITHRARVQREVVRAIGLAGGNVQYDWQWRFDRLPRSIWAPRWLVDSLGIDYFSSVSLVGFHRRSVDADEVAGQVARLGQVDGVLFSGSDLSDEGLARLSTLDIRSLRLAGTAVTDAGLSVARRMTQLEELDLSATSVGDAGLAHLAAFSKLRWLDLGQTRVSDAGMGTLSRFRALKMLVLLDSRIGDPGLARLKSMDNLITLELDGTRATPPAVAALRSALPGTIVIANRLGPAASPIGP